MKGIVPEIRDTHGIDSIFFSVYDCQNGKFALTIEKRGFNQRWGETIRLEITSKRLQKLANDVLNYLEKKVKWEEWKPTLYDLEARLKEEGGFQRINFWFIEWVRRVVTLENAEGIKQARDIYEWLKLNEKWLYEKKVE